MNPTHSQRTATGSLPPDRASGTPPSDAPQVNPGDDAPVGTPGTGDGICRRCGGTGIHDGQRCPDCAGTGHVNVGIGGG